MPFLPSIIFFVLWRPSLRRCEHTFIQSIIVIIIIHGLFFHFSLAY
jgi:hypothetical protein